MVVDAVDGSRLLERAELAADAARSGAFVVWAGRRRADIPTTTTTLIEAVGPGVTGLKLGDRCILSFVSNCGHCRQCRSGNPQLCDTNAITEAPSAPRIMMHESASQRMSSTAITTMVIEAASEQPARMSVE